MNPEDIKKMQEVASRNTQEHHLKFMEELALEELSEEEREDAFMVLS